MENQNPNKMEEKKLKGLRFVEGVMLSMSADAEALYHDSIGTKTEAERRGELTGLAICYKAIRDHIASL